MYEFMLKGGRHSSFPKEIESYIDRLIVEPEVKLPDIVTSRKLGIYARPLTKKGVLRIKDKRAILLFNNFDDPHNILKIRKGKNPVYIFNKL